MLDLIIDTVVSVFFINLPATGSSNFAALPTITATCCLTLLILTPS